MKNKLTENIGLKIASVIAAFLLWLVVVNIDDPVINRTYSNIPVEIVNESLIANEGKCYEISGGTETISVVVSAKRSVLDNMSRDYIKATADMKNLTLVNTVPIEVRVTRFADTIDSVSSRTEYLKIELEDVVKKNVPLNVNTEGSVEPGYLISGVTAKYQDIEITGPESVISTIVKAECTVNVEGLKADEAVNVPITLVNDEREVIDDDRVSVDHDNVSVSVSVWETKEVPIEYFTSGYPADGYSVYGETIVEPSVVVVTGRSSVLNSLSYITIPSDAVDISRATSDVTETINLNTILPEGISIVDEGFDGNVKVKVSVVANDRKIIEVPLSNITVANVPEGYKATIVDIGATVSVEVQGKGDAFDNFEGTLAAGTIDAMSLIPRTEVSEGEIVHSGDFDGQVVFTLPAGISEMAPLYLEVILEKDNGAEILE